MLSAQDKTDILEANDLVASILERRAPEKAKPWWERAGVIPAATAVMTVLVTTVGGYYSQKAVRESENGFVEMQHRTQLARDAALQANSAIASMLKVNEERLKFTRGEFDSLTDSIRIAMARNTNRLQQEWRVSREDAGLALFLAFDSTSGVPHAWEAARDAIERETDCLERAFTVYQSRNKAPGCEKEIAARASAIAELRGSLKLGYDQARRL